MALLKVSVRARESLTMGPGDRREHAEKHGVLSEVKGVWSNGAICGQCQHFSQIGRRNNGANGNCRIVATTDWIEPYRKACSRFKRCETSTTK